MRRRAMKRASAFSITHITKKGWHSSDGIVCMRTRHIIASRINPYNNAGNSRRSGLNLVHEYLASTFEGTHSIGLTVFP